MTSLCSIFIVKLIPFLWLVFIKTSVELWLTWESIVNDWMTELFLCKHMSKKHQMEHVSFINTCGQIHVPINLWKCCATASGRLIILLQRADGIFLTVRNYTTTHICSSHPFLVCWGERLDLTHQQQRSYQRDIGSHLQGLHDLSWRQISNRGDGLPRQAAWTQASRTSCEKVLRPPSHFASVAFVLAPLHFPRHLWS